MKKNEIELKLRYGCFTACLMWQITWYQRFNSTEACQRERVSREFSRKVVWRLL